MNDPVTHGQLTHELAKVRDEIRASADLVRTELRDEIRASADLVRTELRDEIRSEVRGLYPELGRMILASEERLRGEFRIMIERLDETRRDLAEHRDDARIHGDIKLELEAHRLDASVHVRPRRRTAAKRTAR